MQTPYNKLPTVFYDKNDYSNSHFFEDAFLILFIFYAVGFILGIIFNLGAVAVELILVMQLSYVCLINQSFIEIGYYGLIKIGKLTSGYNLMISSHN
jgi:hypothetical protein